MKCNSEKCLQMSASAVDSCGFFFFIFSIVYSNSAVHMNFPLFVCSAVSGHRGAVTHNTVTWFRHFVKCVLCVSIQCVCVCQTPPQHVAPSRTGSHISFFFCVFPHSTVHPDQPVNHRRYNIDTTNNNGLCSGIKQKPCLLLSDFAVCCLKPGTKWECGPVQNHSLRSDPQVKSNVFSESRQDTDYITWIKSQVSIKSQVA